MAVIANKTCSLKHALMMNRYIELTLEVNCCSTLR